MISRCAESKGSSAWRAGRRQQAHAGTWQSSNRDQRGEEDGGWAGVRVVWRCDHPPVERLQTKLRCKGLEKLSPGGGQPVLTRRQARRDRGRDMGTWVSSLCLGSKTMHMWSERGGSLAGGPSGRLGAICPVAEGYRPMNLNSKKNRRIRTRTRPRKTAQVLRGRAEPSPAAPADPRWGQRQRTISGKPSA